MLQDLRDQKNSGLIVIFFALIILAFVFMFGLPSTDCASKSQPDVGTVGKHTITYEMLRSQILQHYDDNIFSNIAYTDTAMKMTQSIGVIYLLADDAREAGLRVSDDELHDYITNWESGNPDILRYGFLQKNKFSQQGYNNALSRFSISSRDYEAYKHEELLARRYLTLLASSISVSDETLWQTFAEDNATSTLEIVRLTSDAVKATFKPLSDEEIAAFENSDDVKKYYDEHRGEFTTPAKAKMQQIVIQKDNSKLQNPGAKTVKSQLPNQRAAIAMRQASENANADFNQLFDDYDESSNKDSKGVTGLLSIDIMDENLQKALDGKKVGDVFQVELSDRYIIVKLMEQTEEVVSPLENVKNEISKKMLEDARIANRIDETSANMISLVSGGKSMEDALNATLYANVLAEQPAAPAVAEGDNADVAAAAEPVAAAVPADLPIVPEFSRIQPSMLNDVATNSGFINGIGVSDDMSRDIRAAAENSVLAKAYKIGVDTIIVRVVSKKEASREEFAEHVNELRQVAIAQKTVELIGDADSILSLQSEPGVSPYGVWIQQKIADAEASGRLKYNNSYFERDRVARQKRQQEREKAENQE